MISGSVIATPISMKTWLRLGAAASQMVIPGGTTFGQMVTPSPAIPRKNNASASQNGALWASPRIARISAIATSPVITGTGAA